jgi:hypothetical protein
MAGTAGDHRVVRGGAFNNNARNVRCAYRNRNNPNNRNRNNGFRVVVVHSFHVVLDPGPAWVPPEMSPGYGLATEVGCCAL